MAVIVQKYGGTSVGSVERIQMVAQKVKKATQQGHQIVVVVSAMSGETNRLTTLAQKIQKQPSHREMDVLLSTGEQVTIALLSMALQAIDCPARSYTGGQVTILTDSSHSKARIKDIDESRVRPDLDSGKVVIIAGFQGIDEEGNITTLGRGGSDTTAVAMAAALAADECQIFTDVDGVYTTDPRIVKNARKLDILTYEEMLELASLGSKVLQIRSVEFASKYNVPLRVLSSFDEGGSGTLITHEDKNMERPAIAGIAVNKDEAKITILGAPDEPGIASKILTAVSDQNIEVDMIIQNIGKDGSTDFTFTVHRNDYTQTLAIIDKVAKELNAKEVLGDNTIVKVSLVGVGMRSHAGIASKMFRILSAANINIEMISTSEIKISVVVDEKYQELAVRELHQGFNLADE